jgi:hypothetical protein
MEEKIQRAETLWQNVQSEPDDVHCWGFYSYGDAPAAIGGGVGSFAWFQTRRELLSFVRDVLPYSPPGSSDTDLGNVEKHVQEIVEHAIEEKIDDKKAIEALNATLRTYSQIEWLGTFEDLICGTDPFAEKIRGEFRESEEESATDCKAISDNEIEELRQFLREYGI